MVFCRVCKSEVGYMGWPNHVRMHKKKVEKHVGHWPSWPEVLEWFWVVPREKCKHYVSLEDYADGCNS